MGKILSNMQIGSFHQNGYVTGVSVLDPPETMSVAAELARFEVEYGSEVWKRIKNKPHIAALWLNRLMRHSRIVDAVEDIFGPNILAWGTSIFAKPARSTGFYNWHQDTTYWGLSEPGVVTAWLALTPSTEESGCMRVIPGSHKTAISHRDTFAQNSLLSRGQEVEADVDESEAISLVLNPGQISLHDGRIIHGSNPNRSNHHRIGVGLRYTTTAVKPITPYEDSATLVRGRDDYGHFLPEPMPAKDFDPECMSFYTRMANEIRGRTAMLTGIQTQ
jgi:non-heme Fe2+,alpha-ketoglutarate-dependent halogenase